MPTQAIPGYTGRVYLSSDGGTTYNEVAELRNVTIKVTTDVLDATSHTSAGNDEVVAGRQRWTASADGLYVPADAGQGALYTAMVGKVKAKFRFDPSGTTTGKERYTGDGFITDWENAQPTNDLMATSLQITGSGALVKSTQ